MIEILREGGPVLWLILLCGIVALAAFVERGFHLHRARIRSDDFLRGIINILGKGNADEAMAICAETPGPVARIVRAAIQRRADGREAMQTAITESGLSEITRLESRVGIIVTVAQVAPLLGLLGTVIGLASLFGDLEATRWQPAEVSDGLKMALITTAAGLIVAIPAYIAHNLVVGKIESLVVDMERASAEIVAYCAGKEKK